MVQDYTRNWETSYENEVMTHTFPGNRIKVITDIQANTISLIKDGERIHKSKDVDLSVLDYNKYLLGVAQSADELNHLSK